MKLSAPIHVLKNQAKLMKKSENITTSQALNFIAKREGFSSWSLLQMKMSNEFPNFFEEILDFINGGDLVLVGARPGYGKTNFTIGLFVKAIQQNRSKSYYFTLIETHKDVAGRIANYDNKIGQNNEVFELNYSNEICADYIIRYTQDKIKPNSVIVVDYLQLLDEKRVNETLQTQIQKLKDFAKEKKCIIIFISQVSRDVEFKNDKRPTLEDIRLPNPFDLKFFNKIIFLYREKLDSKEVEVSFAGKFNYRFKIIWDKTRLVFR